MWLIFWRRGWNHKLGEIFSYRFESQADVLKSRAQESKKTNTKNLVDTEPFFTVSFFEVCFFVNKNPQGNFLVANNLGIHRLATKENNWEHFPW